MLPVGLIKGAGVETVAKLPLEQETESRRYLGACCGICKSHQTHSACRKHMGKMSACFLVPGSCPTLLLCDGSVAERGKVLLFSHKSSLEESFPCQVSKRNPSQAAPSSKEGNICQQVKALPANIMELHHELSDLRLRPRVKLTSLSLY